MTTWRGMFHELGNWHNKISVAAGVARELLKRRAASDMDLSQVEKKLGQTLTQIEGNVARADELILRIKNAVYARVGPNDNIPAEKGGSV